MIASRGPAPFLLVRIIIAQVCVSVNLYFIELNSKFPIFIILKKINGASAITFQTSFQSNSGGGQERQSILIFGADNGNPVNGLLIVWDDGNTLWSGIGNISATMNEKGQIYAALQSIAYDEFVLISAKRIYQ